MPEDDELAPRVGKLEVKVEKLEDQTNRIESHIQSESALARRDILRVEKRMFGDEDAEYGGKIGSINKRIYRMEIWFLALICSAGILGFVFVAWQFINKK